MARYYYDKWNISEYWSSDNKGESPVLIRSIHTTIGDSDSWSTFPQSGAVTVDKRNVTDWNQYTQPYDNSKITLPFKKQYVTMSGDTYYFDRTGKIVIFQNDSYENKNLVAGTRVWWLQNDTTLYDCIVKITSSVGSPTVELTTGTKYVPKDYNHWVSKYFQKGKSKIETLLVEDGTYPNNGIQDGFWYVRGKRAFPDFRMKIDGDLKSSDNGWVKVDSQLRDIDKMWTKIDGVIKEI